MTTAAELELLRPSVDPVAPVTPAIEIQGLRKRFGHTDVLQGLDLTVPRNSVFGFLGPNGAGKSTTMKILVGLLRPTGGSATVAGHDVRHDSVAARGSIGYLPQDVSYWRHLSVRDVLHFTARQYLQGSRRALAQRVDETIELAGLGQLTNRKVGKLSGGERQRLGVAEAWVGRPEVLILDEPSAGLDPEGRHEVLDLLDRLSDEATIFYSTHILDDVERVSDAIAVLSQGHIVAQGPTQDFLVGETARYSVEAAGDGRAAFDDLGRQPWVDTVDHAGDGTWEVTVTDRQQAEHELMRILVDGHNLSVGSFRPSRRSLEEIYLELVTAADADESVEEADHDG